MRIIGMAAPKFGGKDTAADYLIKCMPWRKKVSFADPIKTMLQIGLDLSEAQLWGDLKEEVDPRYGVTPRYLMQTLGTEWGRDMVKNDLWVQAAKTLYAGENIIIADVRNVPGNVEAQYVRDNGVLIHLIGRTQYSNEHISETEIPRESGDIVVRNTGSLEDLYKELTPIVDAFTSWV
jgi:hypothetical protein